MSTVALHDPTTHPPVGSYAWSDKGVPRKILQRKRQPNGDSHSYFLVVEGIDALVPLEMVKGWSHEHPDQVKKKPKKTRVKRLKSALPVELGCTVRHGNKQLEKYKWTGDVVWMAPCGTYCDVEWREQPEVMERKKTGLNGYYNVIKHPDRFPVSLLQRIELIEVVEGGKEAAA